MEIVDQPKPSGQYPFYVFPQVSLGQIIRANADTRRKWQGDEAHRAINSRRCDLLLADTDGNPVAVLEYQGGGHDIDGTAEMRDKIKRLALERAGIRFVEIQDGARSLEIRQTIQRVLDRHMAEKHQANVERRPF